MDTSVSSVVFLNFSDLAGKKLHNFLFQSSNLIYRYKKYFPLKSLPVKFIKRESGLKTFENKGFFKSVYIYFQLKDEEELESLAFQVVIYLK